MRREISANVVIPASRGDVWARLAALPRWGVWNPVVTSLQGDLETGRKLGMELTLPGRNPRILHPEVMRVLPPDELGWITRLWFPGLLDGEHRMLLESSEQEGTTVLIQRVKLSGILLPLLWRRLRPALLEGLRASNQGLKRDMVDGGGRIGLNQNHLKMRNL